MDGNGIGVFIFQAALALFAFFVAGPCVLNALSTFGVQKRFAEEMIDKGIVKAEDVRNMQPKKQVAGIIVSAAVLTALCIGIVRTAPMGCITGLVPLALSLFRYRNILQHNSLTVKRFRNTYKDCLDAKRYNEYVEKNF